MIVLLLCLVSPLLAIRCPEGFTSFGASKGPEYYYHCEAAGTEAELRKCDDGLVYSYKASTCVTSSRKRLKRSAESAEEIDKLEVIKLAAMTTANAHLGTFYNARTQQFSQERLWSIKKARESCTTTPKEYSKVDVVNSDSFKERNAHLHIGASLSIGFMSGLIEVSGAATYLSDVKDSYKHAMVSLTFESTNRAETMPLDVQPSITTTDICAKASTDEGYTHVVTSRVLGARAYLMFKREISTFSNDQYIYGQLSLSIKKIPAFKIEGEGHIKVNNTDIKNTEDLKVEYRGDLSIGAVSTYKDAIYAFNQIKDKAKTARGVIEYELTPLQFFCNNDDELSKPVEKKILDDLIQALTELKSLKKQIDVLVNSNPSRKLPKIRQALTEFSASFVLFETNFKTKTTKVLKELRSSKSTGSEIGAELINTYKNSAFKLDRATLFLNNRKKELETIQLVMETAKAPKFAIIDNSLRSNNPCLMRNRFALEYSLAVIPEDPLAVVQEYLKTKHISDEAGAWFNQFRQVGNAGHRLRNIDMFIDANKDEKYLDTCYLVTIEELNKTSSDYLTVVLRESKGTGVLEYLSRNFIAPSSPPKPVCTALYHGFKLDTEYTNNPVVDKLIFDVKVKGSTDKFEFDNSMENSKKLTLERENLKPYKEHTIVSRYAVRSDRYKLIGSRPSSPGFSPDSKPVKCYTAPSTPVKDLTITNILSTSFAVSFNQPEKIASNLDAEKKYVLEVIPEGKDKNDAILFFSKDPLASPGTTLKNLKPATTYTVSAYLQAPNSNSYPVTKTLATTFDSLPVPEIEDVTTTKASVLFKGSYMKIPSAMTVMKVIFEFWEVDSNGIKIASSEDRRVEQEVNSDTAVDYRASLEPLAEGTSYKARAYLQVTFKTYPVVVDTCRSEAIIFSAGESGKAADRMQKQIDNYKEDLEKKSTEISDKLEQERQALAALKTELEKLAADTAKQFEERAMTKLNTYNSRLPGVTRNTCFYRGVAFYEEKNAFTLNHVSSPHNCLMASTSSKYDAITFELSSKECVGYESQSGKYIDPKPKKTTINKKCYDALSAKPEKWESCIKVGQTAAGTDISSGSGPAESIYDCAAWCWGTKSCVGVTFNTSSKTCQLKSTVSSYSSSSAYSALQLDCLSA